jgi:hypothetical protein
MKRAVAGAIVLGLVTVVCGGDPATRPAGRDDALDNAVSSGRRSYVLLEEVLRLVDRARAAEDPAEAKTSLDEARAHLVDMRSSVSRCIRQIEQASSPGMMQATGAVAVWTCPMHPRIHRDRPGNCPICDATLKATPATASTTRPAVALGDTGGTP